MRALDYYVDVPTGRLVDAAGNRIFSAPEWVRGDRFILRWHFVEVSPGPIVTARVLEEPFAIRLGGKAEAGYGGDYLFLAETAAWNMEGDWAAADWAEGLASCRVDLNSAGLLAHLGAASDYKTLNTDIEIVDGDGNASTFAQFAVRIRNDVVRGDEGISPETAPQYWTREESDARYGQDGLGGLRGIIDLDDENSVYTVPEVESASHVLFSIERPSGGSLMLFASYAFVAGELQFMISALPDAPGYKLHYIAITDPEPE